MEKLKAIVVLLALALIFSLIYLYLKTLDEISTKHNIVFKWVGDDSSIPDDGSLIKIISTDEDTIYIGPNN